MKVSTTTDTLQSWEGTSLIIGLIEGALEQKLNQLERRIGESLSESLKNKAFNAKSGEILSFQLFHGPFKKLILIGLGESNNLVLNELRKATSAVTKETLGNNGVLGIDFPWECFDSNAAVKAVAEALRLSRFKDLRFRKTPEPSIFPENVELINFPESTNQILQEVHPTCEGVELARELVGAPPNFLTPNELANQAKKIAENHSLEVKILDKSECAEKGMGAFLAVSQGSDLAPRFIHLVYKPKGAVKQRLALIGKGLTFDSGGYNLKVGAAQIDMMKFDMGGSAAVLGTARAIAELKPAGIEIHFIIAACENMINGSAVHPGDIVKASNGKTIEINNTDAEGRLTLADALVYACELKPDKIVDLATLTGACVIALGEEIAGLWTEDDQLADDLTTAAADAGEGIWRMPLQDSYKEGLKSLLADIKNTGPRAGGSITAALFLKEFVEESISWAHIDIAGTVWTEKDKGLNPAGATGYGVRTLVNWILKLSLQFK